MTTPLIEGPIMYVPSMDVFLNRWFVTYEDAWDSLQAEGGFLFPYREDFFVAEAEAVRELGLDPDDLDWELIGHDWVRPLDLDAWTRLREKREIAA